MKTPFILASLFASLSFSSFALSYDSSKSLEDNAKVIEKTCQRGRDLSITQKEACYQTAKVAYGVYLRETLKRDARSLQDFIQGEYSEHVLVTTHSFTMSPEDALHGAEYIFDLGGTGIFTTLKAHREDGYELRDVKGKEWREDIHLITQIAQGFGEKVILQGFSLGGLLSIYEAKTYPELVAAYMATAPSFHGGTYLPHSEKSCMARVGLFRKIAEGFSGQDLNNQFVLGGCAIFRNSRKITSNSQNRYFAKYLVNDNKFDEEKLKAKRNLRNLTMPGVIIHSQADMIVSWEVNRVMSEVIKGIAGENFFSYEYNHSGPGHWGDYVYFDGRLPVSAYDGLEFLLKKI